uniref:NADH dehydrogenase subunit 2 n=1 Tax=Ophirina amphinema TaxID=2108040 RepID=A0A348AYT2_9EUKA|nr:NADH dehydrogenase subunit 2 [Ophirina amphinema]
MDSFHWFLPESFFLFGILMVLLYGVVLSVSKTHNYPLLIQNIGILSIWLLTLTSLLLFNNLGHGSVPIFGLFIYDSFGTYIKIILVISTVCLLVLSISYLKVTKVNTFEFYLLSLLSLLGMFFICSSFDLISVYMSIEFQSLCFYVLASLKKDSEYSTESGLKYFVLGAFSSGLLLMGSLLIYGASGTTNFEYLSKIYSADFLHQTDFSITLGLIVYLMGLCFKLYSAPFHVWVPDVYEGSPTLVTAFFSAVPFVSIFALFVRVLFYCFGDLSSYWTDMVAFCACLSLIVGVFGSLAQVKVKRLIAYSAIGHSGYLFLVLSSGDFDSMISALFYIVVYMVTTIGFFAGIMSLRRVYFSSTVQNRFLADFTNLRFINPSLAISFGLILFSMAGIPPLLGFFSKYFVFVKLMSCGLYMYSIFGIIASIIGCVYYLRLIKIMYFIPNPEYAFYLPIPKVNAWLISISVMLLLFGIVDPSGVYYLAENMLFVLNNWY